MEQILRSTVFQLFLQKGKLLHDASTYFLHFKYEKFPSRKLCFTLSKQYMVSFCRISITFRKMDDTKLPYKFKQDPDMHGLQPLAANKITNLPVETPDLPTKFVSGQSNGWKGRADHSSLGATNKQENGHGRSLKVEQNKSEEVETPNKSRMTLGLDEFPPLGSESSKSMRKARLTR